MSQDLKLRIKEYETLLEHAEMMQMDAGTLYCLRDDIEEWKALAGTYENAVDCICAGKKKDCGVCHGSGIISSNIINLGRAK